MLKNHGFQIQLIEIPEGKHDITNNNSFIIGNKNLLWKNKTWDHYSFVNKLALFENRVVFVQNAVQIYWKEQNLILKLIEKDFSLLLCCCLPI